LSSTTVWVAARLVIGRKQPRFVAARIGLDEKPGVDWNMKFKPQLLTAYYLTNDHGASASVCVKIRLFLAQVPQFAGWK
jgi:hypothetical protein